MHLNVSLIHEPFIEVAMQLTRQRELRTQLSVLVLRRQATRDLVQVAVTIVRPAKLSGRSFDQLGGRAPRLL